MTTKILRRALPRLVALALLAGAASPALAGPADKVYRPIVEKGETEFEFRSGYRDFSDGPDVYASVFDVGYGVTNRWKTELVVEYEGETGLGGKMEALEWENVFVLTEQGKYWVDVGLLAEYEHTFGAGPDEIKIGPLFEKEIGRAVATLNLVFEREIGSGASDETELDYRWQVRWRGKEALEFGLQGFGGLGELDHLGDEASHSIGPALFGVTRLKNGDKLAYDAAVLAGINDEAPDLTLRVSFEYEMY